MVDDDDVLRSDRHAGKALQPAVQEDEAIPRPREANSSSLEKAARVLNRVREILTRLEGKMHHKPVKCGAK